jgi:lipopolysaccharide export system protein LptA
MGFRYALRRTRLLLLIGILAVSGLTLESFLARQRRRGKAAPLPAKIAAGVDQQTQAFSLSKSLGGQALYKIQASQVTNFKDTGKTILHNVSIQVFGKKGDREDHITAEECEFDPVSGSLFIPGEVEMEIEAPPAEPVKGTKQAASNPIHIATSALSFNQNTGQATTDREVRFRFTRGEGSSQGAIYNPQDQTITMKSQARFTLWKTEEDGKRDASGTLHSEKKIDPAPAGTPPGEEEATHVAASSLRWEHNGRKILLTAPVEITQGSRQLRAGDSEIFLDEEQRAQRATLGGGVQAADNNSRQQSEVAASRSQLEFTPQGKVRRLLLEGGTGANGQDNGSTAANANSYALWATASAQSLKTGRAERVEMFFEPASGELSRVNAGGQVRVVLSPSLSPSQQLQTLPSFDALLHQDPAPAEGSRILVAQQAEMYLAPGGETLRQARMRSSATIQLFPARPGEDKRTVQGDSIDMEFSPQGDLSEFTADENVRLTAEAAGKIPRKRASSSDHLWASLDRRTHAVSRMRQWGRFAYQDPDRQARAQQADYTAEGDVIALQGEPLVWNSSGKLSAEKISLLNGSGEVRAESKVSTTYFPAPSPGNPPPLPVHVVADHLEYQTKTQKAVYQGHARMWQASDLIEAGRLEIDRQQQTLAARNDVFSVFPGRTQSQGKKPASAGRNTVPEQETYGPVEIRSGNLFYSEAEQKARYEGEVRMQNSSATLTSKELEILFAPPPPESPVSSPRGAQPTPGGGREIERAIANGNVLIVQPGRQATGDRAEYVPGESKIILSGNLAAISDAQKGNTQGARLTYFTRDDTIFVQGEPGSPTDTRRLIQRGAQQ